MLYLLILDGIEITKDFENKFYSIIFKFSKCIRETSPWYTVVHGDAVINNFLFNETQAKLVDLQMLCCASVSYDLVSLIFISTEKMFRDTHLDYLLLHYYRQLTHTISQVTNLSRGIYYKYYLISLFFVEKRESNMFKICEILIWKVIYKM